MICGYCKIFRAARIRKWKFVTEKSRISRRYCNKVEKFVENETDWCSPEIFEISKYFWCSRWNCWMMVLACLARRRNGTCKCHQGSDIVEVCRGKSLQHLNSRKRKLVKRKKNA